MNNKMICSRCKQRPAVIFVSRIDGDKTTQEGFCIKCASELNIGPIKQMMENMGITEEDIDAMFAGTYVGIEDEDPEPDVNIKALVSSDGYVLKDSNGLYVKAKEVI
jgi:hypothetical protein